ncbi:hypothetical protein SUGI_0020610 [Cryptomeria japonica]|nr:hypothetical protein SUGI_0020610 [Cryptomeria japonica]
MAEKLQSDGGSQGVSTKIADEGYEEDNGKFPFPSIDVSDEVESVDAKSGRYLQDYCGFRFRRRQKLNAFGTKGNRSASKDQMELGRVEKEAQASPSNLKEGDPVVRQEVGDKIMDVTVGMEYSETKEIWLSKDNGSGEDLLDIIDRRCLSQSAAIQIEWDGAFHEACGMSRGIGILWNPKSIQFGVLEQSDNWMAGVGRHIPSNASFLLVNVYGPPNPQKKAVFWESLLNVLRGANCKEIIVGGDFNAILNLNEKVGGLMRSSVAMVGFRQFIQPSQLCDIEPNNGKFTWMNKRINFTNTSERLDHFLISKEWVEREASFFSSILPYLPLDHFPIFLKWNLLIGGQKDILNFRLCGGGMFLLCPIWKDGGRKATYTNVPSVFVFSTG